jgi:membrane fusion protein, multidrug efflux system
MKEMTGFFKRDGTRLLMQAGIAVAAALLVPFLARADQSSFPCYVTPNVTISVGSSATGVLEYVTVKPGSLVKAGQVLARLESSFEEAEVDVAKAKAEMAAPLAKAEIQTAFSERKVNRAQELSKTSAIGRHELDEAETEQHLARTAQREALEYNHLSEVELKRARTVVDLRTVRSPIDGVVVDVLLFPGELVKQAPIMTIAQLDPLRVQLVVPAATMHRLRTGMAADVRLDWHESKTHQAKVVLINPVLEPATRTVVLHLELPNPGHQIPPWLSCAATFSP